MNRLINELFDCNNYLIKTIINKDLYSCNKKCFFNKKQNNLCIDNNIIYTCGIDRKYVLIKGFCNFMNRYDRNSVIFKNKKI